jgi:1-phosphofructokinase
MGKDGACFVTANEAVVARPPDVDVRSTVGAGDAMVAGIIAAQARKLTLADCARLATAFSVHALIRTSDDTNSSDAINSIQPQVSISSLR